CRAPVVALEWRDGFLTDVSDAIQSRLRAAAPGDEIERPVDGMDDDIRYRQRRAIEELLQFALVGAAVGRQVQGVELAIAPVAQEQCFLILGGEPGAVAEGHASR